MEGAISLSVPVRNISHNVIGSLSLSIPKMRDEDEKNKEYLKVLKEGADSIENLLGGVSN